MMPVKSLPGSRVWVFVLGLALLVGAFSAPGAAPKALRPFEIGEETESSSPIDSLVLAVLQERGIEAAPLCSDEVFVRRVFLDILGTLPEPGEVREFLRDRAPGKRAALVDSLFEREEYADYWALKWGDLLRIKAEFPINLWPNAVQAYHRWVYDAMRENLPYDAFVRDLLTSSGSNFRVPPVNFYRAIQGQEASSIAQAVALTFMGARIEHWPEDRRDGMETLFSRVAYKGTAEWKEEIVYLDPAPAEALDTVFPDGTPVHVEADEDPRYAFANWLLAPANPWFARTVVNRQWAWLLGRGIIHEPDDIRPDNPPVNPELLDYLEEELVDSGYDLQHVFRLILNSRTYQQSSIPRGDHPEAEALFAHYGVRRLDAEVLIDALCRVFGSRESYMSPIPEPFTYIPEEHRTIELADGSITSQFLEMFGRPARDTGYTSERNNTPTDAQRLHLINSSHIQQKIERSGRMHNMFRNAKDPAAAIRSLYLTLLSRYPTRDELEAVRGYYRDGDVRPKEATEDLAWALVNTKEFLYRH